MTKGDPELEQVIRLLRRDVRVTVGPEYDADVTSLAANVLTFREANDAGDKIIEDVQQYLHDTFVDNTWPTCPRHPNHPMWFRDKAWWCEQDKVPLVRLGERPSRDLDGGERS